MAVYEDGQRNVISMKNEDTLETVQVYPKPLHLSLDCKLNALSCSEVSSSSPCRMACSHEGSLSSAGSAGSASPGVLRRTGSGDASSPRSMLGARIRISGTLISLNLRLKNLFMLTAVNLSFD